MSFKHEIGKVVRLELTSESGTVIGRAEYDRSENAYFVRYVTTDGRQSEAWWVESAIAG